MRTVSPSLWVPDLRYIARFPGLRRFWRDGWLAWLPAQPLCCGIPASGLPVLEACARLHPHAITRQLREARQIHAQDLGDACYILGILHPELPLDLLSSPERSTEPVVLSRDLPPVAARDDAARLRGEGRDFSS